MSVRRAHHVIIAIRGAIAVDTQVVEALLQTAQALELLGCQVTLTGISPTLALTLTRLGTPVAPPGAVGQPLSDPYPTGNTPG